METQDLALLNAMQNHFPLERHPYQPLGKMVGLTEEETYVRVRSLRQDGVIRRLGGVFDSRRLGYFSTLCTAKVPEEKISALAEFLNRIPGVTHNYIRDHAYNIWFTLIAPSEEAADSVLAKIRASMALPEIYSLPAVRMFKINVNFDFEAANEESGANDKLESVVDASLEDIDWDNSLPEEKAPYPLSEEDVSLIRLLQGNLPDSLTPYDVLAEGLHWPVEDLLARATCLLEQEVMRRFGAVLRHRKAGFLANAMGVWNVEPEKAAGVGKVMARFKEVSHCYQRPTLSDWPYSLFTMIHGRTVQDCEIVMQKISLATGIENYAMLFSTAELKKSSMQYFREEETN